MGENGKLWFPSKKWQLTSLLIKKFAFLLSFLWLGIGKSIKILLCGNSSCCGSVLSFFRAEFTVRGALGWFWCPYTTKPCFSMPTLTIFWIQNSQRTTLNLIFRLSSLQNASEFYKRFLNASKSSKRSIPLISITKIFFKSQKLK